MDRSKAAAEVDGPRRGRIRRAGAELLSRVDRLGRGGAIGAGVGLGLLGGGAAMLWPDALWGYVVGGVSLVGSAALTLTGAPVGGLQGPASLLDMVDLPAGRFLMGDEQREVAVAAFSIGRYPVTQGEYKKVTGKDPGHPKGADLPVNNVSFYEAIEFCNLLSLREGMRPCYAVGEGGLVEWLPDGDGYRLPTEAEWEYAVRGGTQTEYFFGDDPAELPEYAWFAANSEGQVRPVGKKRPNPFGLHDMIGNVWEWCWDTFLYDGEGDESRDKSSDPRALRGGSFVNEPSVLRSTFRVWDEPSCRVRVVGFRCVWSPARSP